MGTYMIPRAFDRSYTIKGAIESISNITMHAQATCEMLRYVPKLISPAPMTRTFSMDAIAML